MAFAYRDGALCAESVPLDEIAQRFGTPCYVYSRAEIEHNYRAFEQALAGREAMVAYSVKANSNLAVLALLAKLGSGFDIVSSGELDRVRVWTPGQDPRPHLFEIAEHERELSAKGARLRLQQNIPSRLPNLGAAA